MLKIIIVMFAVIMPDIVHAATCAAGSYLDGTTCRACKYEMPKLTYPVYCPGDDMRYDCPTSSADYNALAAQLGHTFSGAPNANIWSSEAALSIRYCKNDLQFKTPEGNVYLAECAWNGDNYYLPCIDSYGRDRAYMYLKAGTGYYLSDWVQTTTQPYYNGAKACTNKPANSHYTGPGTPDEPKSGGTKDYNDCPWECDSGYGRHGDVCTTLCTAGFTQLKTSSGVTVNVYADKPSTPALNISTSRGTCYVTLATGAANSAINVNYNGATYHTTD